MINFIKGLYTKIRTGLSKVYVKTKCFVINNPIFTCLAITLLIAGFLNYNVAALLFAAAIITAITMFWAHVFTLVYDAVGGMNEKLS